MISVGNLDTPVQIQSNTFTQNANYGGIQDESWTAANGIGTVWAYMMFLLDKYYRILLFYALQLFPILRYNYHHLRRLYADVPSSQPCLLFVYYGVLRLLNISFLTNFSFKMLY